MRLVRKFIPFAFILALTGCANDSTEDLISVPVNTGNAVTYNLQVKSIIQNNCVSCHSSPTQNLAPMPLTTYDEVKNAVINRGLLDRISRPQGASGLMPSNGNRMPQASIDIINQWAANGFQE